MMKDKELPVVLFFAAVFFVAGAGLVYWGWYLYSDIQSVRNKGIKTVGVILRYERRVHGPASSHNQIMAVPIVKFRTESGQSVIVEGNVDNTSILQNLCQGGDRVEIIYDPQNPQHAFINTFAELWFAPLLLWVIGVGFIIGPPFTIWRHYNAP
ncbi:MAG TPA: DUF3592 domain-containing protein [Sedimenticola sp.]|nr:DUF3592 domain-containing protein [Sedimenticola sp.]